MENLTKEISLTHMYLSPEQNLSVVEASKVKILA